jgi:hypothetical protein
MQILSFKATFVAMLFTFAGITTVFAQSNALVFDGTDDAVNLGNTLGNFGTGDFTVELSIKTTLPSQFVVAKRPVCGHASFWNLSVSDGLLVVEVDGDYTGGNYAVVASPAVVNDGAWHHIALVRQATAVTLYIDGAVAGTNAMPATADLTNDAPLYIGVNGACGGRSNFGGTMDEVRFWSVARSAADIAAFSKQSIAPSTANLVAYYPCNDAAATLTDATGHNYNGTMTAFAANCWVADSPIAAAAVVATIPAPAVAPPVTAVAPPPSIVTTGGFAEGTIIAGLNIDSLNTDADEAKVIATINAQYATENAAMVEQPEVNMARGNTSTATANELREQLKAAELSLQRENKLLRKLNVSAAKTAKEAEKYRKAAERETRRRDEAKKRRDEAQAALTAKLNPPKPAPKTPNPRAPRPRKGF